jgi:hypothetical protein
LQTGLVDVEDAVAVVAMAVVVGALVAMLLVVGVVEVAALLAVPEVAFVLPVVPLVLRVVWPVLPELDRLSVVVPPLEQAGAAPAVSRETQETTTRDGLAPIRPRYHGPRSSRNDHRTVTGRVDRGARDWATHRAHRPGHALPPHPC